MDKRIEEKRRAAAAGGPEDQEAYARDHERTGTRPSAVRPQLVAEFAVQLSLPRNEKATARSAASAVKRAREIVDLAFGATEGELDVILKKEGIEFMEMMRATGAAVLGARRRAVEGGPSG